MTDMNYLKARQIGKAMAVNDWSECAVKCYLVGAGFSLKSFTATRLLRAYNEQLALG